MTAAVCIFCGAVKIGAWTPCDSCGQVPRTQAECVVALVATDHYQDPASLKELSDHVRHGNSISVDPQTRREVETLLRATKIHELVSAMGVDGPGADGADDLRAPEARPPRVWEFWKRQQAQVNNAVEIEATEVQALEAAGQENWDEAFRLLSSLVRQGGVPWTVWANRGKVLLNQARYQQAVADLSQALRVAPASAKASILNDRGIARKKAGELPEAIDDYSSALELDAEFHSVLVNRGIARFELGDLAGATADLQAACDLGVPEAASLLQQIDERHSSALDATDRNNSRSSPGALPIHWIFKPAPLCKSMVIGSDGKATIHARPGTNPIHPVAHIWLRWLPDQARERAEARDALLRLEGWAGVVDGIWTVEQEERVAEQIEAFLLNLPAARSLAPGRIHQVAPEIEPVIAKLLRLLGKPKLVS